MHVIDLSAHRASQKVAKFNFAVISAILAVPGTGFFVMAMLSFWAGEINVGFLFLAMAFGCGVLIALVEALKRAPRGDVRDLVDTEENQKLRAGTGRARYDFLRNEPALLLSSGASVAVGAGALVALAGHTRIPFHVARAVASTMRGQARRHAALSGSELSMKDTRPLVLYLRSFNDEKLLTEATGAWSLEQIVVEAGSLLGPVVAIGRPGEGLPPLGAARDYVTDEEWQQHAHGWMEQATAIFFAVGETEGLAWEAARIARLRALRKCVLMIPPTDSDEIRRRWNTFMSRLGRVAPELHTSLSGVEVERANALTFGPDLKPLVIWAGACDAAAYDVSLTYALGIICNHGSEIVPGKENAPPSPKWRDYMKSLSIGAITVVTILGIARLTVYGICEYPNRWKHDLRAALRPITYEEGLIDGFSERKGTVRSTALWAFRPETKQQDLVGRLVDFFFSYFTSSEDPGQTYKQGREIGLSHAATPFVAGYVDGSRRRRDDRRSDSVAPADAAEAYARETASTSRDLSKSRYPDSPGDRAAYRRGYIQGAVSLELLGKFFRNGDWQKY